MFGLFTQRYYLFLRVAPIFLCCWSLRVACFLILVVAVAWQPLTTTSSCAMNSSSSEELLGSNDSDGSPSNESGSGGKHVRMRKETVASLKSRAAEKEAIVDDVCRAYMCGMMWRMILNKVDGRSQRNEHDDGQVSATATRSRWSLFVAN
jgi:hypothetical protein